jgi:hypothetical protein
MKKKKFSNWLISQLVKKIPVLEETESPLTGSKKKKRPSQGSSLRKLK